MWNQEASSKFPGWPTSHKTVTKKATLQILPCTVSQLLSACQVGNDAFAICDLELNQVSIVGTVRGSAPCATYSQYFVDDMTGPPLDVKQWINTEESSGLEVPEPGMYIKVHGSLRMFKGIRSLLAMNIYCIKDLNEITSHMLEVVNAHMQLFGKSCDVNMNTDALAVSDGPHTLLEGCIPKGLPTIQAQVMNVINQHSVKDVGISFQDLIVHLDHIGIKDMRKSLAFLISEGHVFSTIDENHFKSTAH